MATYGSLEHIFGKPMPENPTLIESLSRNNNKPFDRIHPSASFTEIFGELHFYEPACLLDPPSSSATNLKSRKHEVNQAPADLMSSETIHVKSRRKKSTSSMSLESLQLCTESLGFESFDVDDVKNELSGWQNSTQTGIVKQSRLETAAKQETMRFRTSRGTFPPPLTSMGNQAGTHWVRFKSCRQDGRFILIEERIPRPEILHACREVGRLRLHFVHPMIPKDGADDKQDECQTDTHDPVEEEEENH
uniref:FAF domain-containing protein n=1 Tax=Kalanchoe fedtschenkoi TaxID=63787 RepID=A0A7N0U7I4_KALFE